MFEKATKAVKEVSETVIDSAKTFGTYIYNSSKEQGEIASLKIQKASHEKALQEFYAMIGRRYCDYVKLENTPIPFDARDIVSQMQQEIEELNIIDAALLQKEINAKKQEEERRQKKAQDSYDTNKSQLDKALEMEIITQEEYDEKMKKVQRRFDNYEQLRKIDLQLQMGIIDQEEHDQKVEKVLS